ncbi:hemolymph lipopolysaccharide-binding protein isoform X2 [Anabrus simplex]|uniref:hemolymph lipopolysaccharide-binding protein isoform X2 n=1 Tax=Anabrus simplex TaxID=316456 RepID=UPI0035A3CBF5
MIGFYYHLPTITMLLPVLFLLFPATAVYGTTEMCTAAQRTNIALSVASRRNSTGHWTVSINLLNNVQKGKWPKMSPREIFLEVQQHSSVCQDMDTHELAITTSEKIPEEGYEYINGLGYYRMHTIAITWEQARAQCEKEGTHLIVINSEAEATVVKEFFARGIKIQNATRDYGVHTGIHDRYEEGKFVTITGETLETVGYKNMALNEPNGGRVENCMAVSNEGRYFDISCTTWKLAYICEQ